MPYAILSDGRGGFRVVNTATGKEHAHHTTLAKAESQVRLLRGVEHGMVPLRMRDERLDPADSGTESESEEEEEAEERRRKRHLKKMMKADHPDPPKKFIQGVVESPEFMKGDFTRKAKEHGKKPLEFMKEVLASPAKFDLHTRRQAQFLANIQRK